MQQQRSSEISTYLKIHFQQHVRHIHHKPPLEKKLWECVAIMIMTVEQCPVIVSLSNQNLKQLRPPYEVSRNTWNQSTLKLKAGLPTSTSGIVEGYRSLTIKREKHAV